MDWLWFLLIGLLAGWLSGILTRGRGFGLLGDVAVGVIGALVGGFVFTLLGIRWFGAMGALVTATAGSVILLFVLSLTRQRNS